MKQIFDQLSTDFSKTVTRRYSTSFSLGIRFLHGSLHRHIYAVYGFVRLADEIVDSFHGYDKSVLLDRFVEDTYEAIEGRISLNPVLNAFQKTYHQCNLSHELVDAFFRSMKMDLQQCNHNTISYNEYIFGSAESVGLMCLKVFTHGNDDQYNKLRYYAMKLGSAFQKVNFLRDAQEDYQTLGRNYFPNVNLADFSAEQKRQIELDIRADFEIALVGIRQLSPAARGGVYLAYYYYWKLFQKICKADAAEVMRRRIRIPNLSKIIFMFNSYLRFQFNLL